MEHLIEIMIQRGEEYGSWQTNLNDLGNLWGRVITTRIQQGIWKPGDPLPNDLVAFMLCLLKVIRELERPKQDNLDDLANYAIFGAVSTQQKRVA